MAKNDFKGPNFYFFSTMCHVFLYFKHLKNDFTKKFIKDNSCTTTYSKCV